MATSVPPKFERQYWLHCRPCDKKFLAESTLRDHHASSNHKINARGAVQPYERFCSKCTTRVQWQKTRCPQCHPASQSDSTAPMFFDSTCRVVCVSCFPTRGFDAHSYAQHISSPSHRLKVQDLREQFQHDTAMPIAYLCECSPEQFQTTEAYREHVQTELHAKRMRAKSLTDKMENASRDNQHSQQASTDGDLAADIWFDTNELHFGFRANRKEHKKNIWLSNRGTSPIRLTNALVLPRTGWGDTFFSVTGPRGAVLQPSSRIQYTLHFSPKNPGYYDQCVIFRFEGGKDIVGRMTGAVSDNPEALKMLAPTSKFKKKTKKDDFLLGRPVTRLEKAVPYDEKRSYSKIKALGQYKIPKALASKLRLAVDDAVEAIRRQVKFPFTTQSYIQAMSTLLHAEEDARFIDIREYDIHGARLEQTKGKRYFLAVPGLAEARPSVIRTDSITISPSKDTTNAQAFQGWVTEVHEKRVLIEFPPAFNKVYHENQRYDVRFSFNRQPFRRMHAALNNPTSTRFAFPDTKTLTISDDQFAKVREFADKMECYVNGLNSNAEQKLAAYIIANRLHGDTPFVLYGPPGTGKTNTLVEAILQIRRKADFNKERYHILVCTPSNPAADLILTRLSIAGINEDEMIRVNSPSRSKFTMPMKSGYERYCFYDDEKHFIYPTSDEIDRASIVIMTNIAAGVLSFFGECREFTHIILDEAAQCFEPETLVPLQMAKPKTSVVLAGDHHQLGPMVRSPVAHALGLGICMLERLVNLPPNKTPYPWGQEPSKSSNLCGVKLLKNYRSHPELMSLSSRLFYKNELLYEAPRFVVEQFLQWPGLPQEGYPLKFVGVEGVDEREGNSPSWFNVFEAEAVVREIKSLLDYSPLLDGHYFTVSGKDIGVIVPYRKQVEKIMKLLTHENVRDRDRIKVDTVERFQGLERPVMIVSTVRSQAQFLEQDKKFNLGFVSNPKRFNVSITRARALLIIVGNPNVLIHDEYWKMQIREIATRGGATGASVPMHDIKEEDCVDELVRLVDKLEVQQPIEAEAYGTM